MPTVKPNILIIFADELRADALGCYGNTICRTPHLDRLASEGVRFDQCMVTQPTCTPSRASVLTGTLPSAIRSRMVGCRTPEDPRFMTYALKEAGYITASIGKIHLVPQGEEPDAVTNALEENGHYYGFDQVDLVNAHGANCFGPDYNAWLEENFPGFKEQRKKCRPFQYGINQGKVKTHHWDLPEKAHSSFYIADRTINFLDQAGDQPFFLHVSFPDPHHPFTVPEPYASMYKPEDMPEPLPPVAERDGAVPQMKSAFYNREGRMNDRVTGTPPVKYPEVTQKDWKQVKAVYYGMVTLMDEQIGRIVDALENTGLSDNTVIVFASDHGDYLGDHGLVGKGFHFDSVIRTPLIIKGAVWKPQTVTDITSALDIAPTLLDMAGAEIHESMQGVSMLGALNGNTAFPRAAALTENDDDIGQVRFRTLTTGEWKLTVYANEKYGELYDRIADPDELNNLWDNSEYADRKQEMKNMLLEELMCAFDTINARVQKPVPEVKKWFVKRASKT